MLRCTLHRSWQQENHAQGPHLRVVHRPFCGRCLHLLQEPLHVFRSPDAGRRRSLLTPRKAADAQHTGKAALWPLKSSQLRFNRPCGCIRLSWNVSVPVHSLPLLLSGP